MDTTGGDDPHDEEALRDAAMRKEAIERVGRSLEAWMAYRGRRNARKFAGDIGVSRQTISYAVNRQRLLDYPTLRKIAEGLETTAEALMRGDMPPPGADFTARAGDSVLVGEVKSSNQRPGRANRAAPQDQSPQHLADRFEILLEVVIQMANALAQAGIAMPQVDQLESARRREPTQDR